MVFDEICTLLSGVLLSELQRECISTVRDFTLQEILLAKPLNIITWPFIARSLLIVLRQSFKPVEAMHVFNAPATEREVRVFSPTFPLYSLCQHCALTSLSISVSSPLLPLHCVAVILRTTTTHPIQNHQSLLHSPNCTLLHSLHCTAPHSSFTFPLTLSHTISLSGDAAGRHTVSGLQSPVPQAVSLWTSY